MTRQPCGAGLSSVRPPSADRPDGPSRLTGSGPERPSPRYAPSHLPIPRRLAVSSKTGSSPGSWFFAWPAPSRLRRNPRRCKQWRLPGPAPHGQWRDRVGFAPNFSIKLACEHLFSVLFGLKPSYHAAGHLSITSPLSRSGISRKRRFISVK